MTKNEDRALREQEEHVGLPAAHSLKRPVHTRLWPTVLSRPGSLKSGGLAARPRSWYTHNER